MKKNRVTLRDIAERAGLTRAAVSYALRNHPSIPRHTVERVRGIADDLGYSPDAEVSKLMAHVRGNQSVPYQATIAWLTSWPTEDGWQPWLRDKRIFAGASHRAGQLGYLLEPFWLRAVGMTGKRASSILRARGVEAAIVAPLPDGMHTINLEWAPFAVVAIGYLLQQPDIHRVESAHTYNFELALRKIRERGVVRIGFIESEGTDTRVSRAWTGTFLADQQNQPRRDRIPLLKKERITRKDFATWFLRYAPEVIISNECPVIPWVAEMGLKVPTDVGHVRLDCVGPELLGRYELAASGPWLSGIDQMPEEVGGCAVDAVVAQLHMRESGIPAKPRVTLVKGQWRDHDTLAPEASRAKANGSFAEKVARQPI